NMLRGDSPSRTSVSLLARLRKQPGDAGAWEEFVRRYGPKIYRWCQDAGLQAPDAEDVTQNVLARLASKMGGFEYDPGRSFRGWLRTLTRHARSDFRAARQHGGSAGGPVQDLLDNVAAQEDLLSRLEREFDLELFEEALARVRGRVPPHWWEAFRLTSLEQLS